MHNEQAAPPPGTICVGGPIVMGPVTIRCHCGAPMNRDTVWQVCVQERPGEIGEDAWGRCPAGHEFHHPMIYPKFVHTVLTWQDHADENSSDLNAPGLYDLLDEIVWRPHHRLVHEPMYTGGRRRIFWCAWDRLDLLPFCGEPEYWRREWPDLWNAAHREPPAPRKSTSPDDASSENSDPRD
ncbi:MAG: hypothetical protein J2P26_01805 [Nocardiopsaceae bacterium]|nr:hypothetical protein [Nocardiopsaceae bacterium]